MAWTVRTPHGSLDFASLGEIERAYRMGLVSPEDEVRESGKETWRRADSFPALRASHPTKSSGLPTSFMWSLAVGIVLAVSALICLANGQWILAIVLAIALSIFLLKFTARAVAPKRTFVRV